MKTYIGYDSLSGRLHVALEPEGDAERAIFELLRNSKEEDRRLYFASDEAVIEVPVGEPS